MKPNAATHIKRSRLLHLLLTLLFISNYLPAKGQVDLESKEDQKIIAKYKIKEATSYLSPEGSKPDVSLLVDHMFFNTNGLCIKQRTNNYTSMYYYNILGQRIKSINKPDKEKGSSVRIYDYDTHGNMLTMTKISDDTKEKFKDFVVKRVLTYNADNEILSETWFDKRGHKQSKERYEYLAAEPDKGIIKIVKHYDMYDNADRLKKIYADSTITTYITSDDRNNRSYEQYLDKNGRVVRVVNHHHFGPHSFDMVEKYGHGIIETSVVTELYKYNEYGLCSEKLTYKENKLIERQWWVYKL